MSVLDDLKMIHERDAQDALGIAEKQYEQLLHSYEIAQWDDDFTPKNVVYAGMGGSSLSALLSQCWPKHTVPFEVCRTYDIPGYVGNDTLFIAASFSGTTEETLAALSRAEEAGARIAVIASGGKLAEIAQSKGYAFAQLPQISQPRYGALYVLKAIVQLLVMAKLTDQNVPSELEQQSEWLKGHTASWRADVATANNPTKQLAQEVAGTTPVIYASDQFFPVAYKWKISFNENAKNVAWCNAVPEFNHNEFLGWSSHPVDKPYTVIDLRSSLDHPQIQKRFDISDRLLSGKRPAAHSVELQGETALQQMLYGVAFGDFVSLYTALLNGLNPTPVDLITKLKTELVN
mgnify:CR=1 FL=1